MRIYISADIEGMPGVVSRANLMPGHFEYEQARDWMTDAVLVACEAAREAGAQEIVVSDSHGNGQNIRYERMPAGVQLVRSWPRPLGMVSGIDVGHFDGALLLGYHAGGSNPGGTLSHTLSGEFFHEVRINGVVASEAAISAAIAGHFGVPVLLVAGDDVAVQEACEQLGDIATATLKHSQGWQSARTLAPLDAQASLRAGVNDAMSRIGRAKPFVIGKPCTLEIRLRTRFVAEWLSYLDGVDRTDAYSIRYQGADIAAISRFLTFVGFARAAVAS
jgi:D-amino peptidase